MTVDEALAVAKDAVPSGWRVVLHREKIYSTAPTKPYYPPCAPWSHCGVLAPRDVLVDQWSLQVVSDAGSGWRWIFPEDVSVREIELYVRHAVEVMEQQT